MRDEYHRGELEISQRLALGGAGAVYNCTLPGGEQLMFKEYFPETAQFLQERPLRSLVRFPGELSPDDRSHLFEIAAWPKAVVVSDDGVAGILMDAAREHFFYVSKVGRKPRELAELGASEQTAESRNTFYYELPLKAAALGSLLINLDFLHQHGVVFGDLQPKNVLITAPVPSVPGSHRIRTYLLDCDSFVLRGQHAMPTLDPPAYKMPLGFDISGFNERTDLFKFVLIASRAVQEDWGAPLDVTRFQAVAPGWVVDHLEAIGMPGRPTIGSHELKTIGSTWQKTIKLDGSLWVWNDAGFAPYVRVPSQQPVSRPAGSTTQASTRTSSRRDAKVAIAVAAVILIAIAIVFVIVNGKI